MPWNGSGQVERTDGAGHDGFNVFAQQEGDGTPPMSTLFDAVSEDLANAIELCVNREGENSPTVNLPMNDKKHTGVADAINRTDYAAYGQALDLAGQYVAALDVGGTANAITLTPTTGITAYTAGLSFRIVIQAANTGAVTVAVSGLDAQPLTKRGSTALARATSPSGRWPISFTTACAFSFSTSLPHRPPLLICGRMSRMRPVR